MKRQVKPILAIIPTALQHVSRLTDSVRAIEEKLTTLTDRVNQGGLSASPQQPQPPSQTSGPLVSAEEVTEQVSKAAVELRNRRRRRACACRR